MDTSADIAYTPLMDTNPLSEERLEAAKVGAYFRPRDVEPLGVSYRAIQQMVAEGSVEKLGFGLYRLADVDPDPLETIAMVASAAPGIIVCLLTALNVHQIGTQMPRETWVAIDRKARKPRRVPTRLRIVRFSGVMLTYGVVEQTILGVPVAITTPARTVVDCFRYRNKIGIDVALEALRDSLRTRVTTVDEIERAAEVCRTRTVIGPYLEALSA